ncbi:MAG: hypothetical protein AAGA67_13915 [Cyanobacteria bacterium P01_F01_bin.153]
MILKWLFDDVDVAASGQRVSEYCPGAIAPLAVLASCPINY